MKRKEAPPLLEDGQVEKKKARKELPPPRFQWPKFFDGGKPFPPPGAVYSTQNFGGHRSIFWSQGDACVGPEIGVYTSGRTASLSFNEGNIQKVFIGFRDDDVEPTIYRLFLRGPRATGISFGISSIFDCHIAGRKVSPSVFLGFAGAVQQGVLEHLRSGHVLAVRDGKYVAASGVVAIVSDYLYIIPAKLI